MIDILHATDAAGRLDEIIGPGLLCAFDFDGTLAPIVPQPDMAKLPETVRSHLIALSAHAPVAIITGRSIDDIHQRLGFDPDFIVGNHGLEGVPGWEGAADEYVNTCRRWKEDLQAALQSPEFDRGIMIEDKNYSLSVHYRMVQDHSAAESALDKLFSRLQPAPRVVWGKMVFNLTPQDAGHKGTALTQLMKITGSRSAIYVGDDITDEDVFRLDRPDVLSVRVEHSPHSAAEAYLQHPDDIVQLLELLVRRMQALGTAKRQLSPTAFSTSA
jgi:trehalose 6-phosphate phosphatase